MQAHESQIEKITPICPISRTAEELRLDHHQTVTRTYRYLFIGMGILFCFLGLTAFMKTLTGSLSLWLGSYKAIRSVLCFLCFSLAACAFTIGIHMRAEVEACKKLAVRAIKRLRRHLTKKKLENGLHGSFYWGEKAVRLAKLNHAYEIAKHHINDHKEEALHQVKYIKQNIHVSQAVKQKQMQQILQQLDTLLEEEINSFLFSKLAAPFESSEHPLKSPLHTEIQGDAPAQDNR